VDHFIGRVRRVQQSLGLFGTWKIMSIARRETLKGAGGRSEKFRAVGAHGGGAVEFCY
jgi:hypothetical protein